VKKKKKKKKKNLGNKVDPETNWDLLLGKTSKCELWKSHKEREAWRRRACVRINT
jgi:hypothetical protein